MGNILDKCDKSMAPTCGSPAVSKTEKYNWATGGPQGEFMLIDKRELSIDDAYQRGQISEAKVREIARNWDWLFLGAISVVVRPDGSYWIFDGGHRVRAAFYRSDISALPCMVHPLESLSAEAKAFVARNTMVSNVSAMDRHQASITAGEPVALQTKALLDKFGIRAVKRALNSHSIACIGSLRKAVAEDYDDASRTLEFCIQQASGEAITRDVFEGIFTLQRHFSGKFDFLEEHGPRLSKFTAREMQLRIRQYRAETGKGGEKIYALGCSM